MSPGEARAHGVGPLAEPRVLLASPPINARDRLSACLRGWWCHVDCAFQSALRAFTATTDAVRKLTASNEAAKHAAQASRDAQLRARDELAALVNHAAIQRQATHSATMRQIQERHVQVADELGKVRGVCWVPTAELPRAPVRDLVVRVCGWTGSPLDGRAVAPPLACRSATRL